MNPREKLLAAAVASLVILWGASQGWSKYQAALERNLDTQRTIAQELSTVRTATARGRRAQQMLHKWRRQSLPTDADIAKSLYQDWLYQQLTAAGLKVKEVNPSSPRASSKSYQQFTFTVNASGKLEQLTDFLYRFYKAKHLHRISLADVKPTADRNLLNLTLAVDTLSLGDANRSDQLAEGSSDEFEQPLEHFRNSIVERNLFATYKPPATSQSDAGADEKSAPDKEAAQAKFSAIHYGQDGWVMLVRMQNSGKIYYFQEGDTIEIGRFVGKIEKLDGDLRRAILTTDSARVELRWGKTLAEVEPLVERAS